MLLITRAGGAARRCCRLSARYCTIRRAGDAAFTPYAVRERQDAIDDACRDAYYAYFFIAMMMRVRDIMIIFDYATFMTRCLRYLLRRHTMRAICLRHKSARCSGATLFFHAATPTPPWLRFSCCRCQERLSACRCLFTMSLTSVLYDDARAVDAARRLIFYATICAITRYWRTHVTCTAMLLLYCRCLSLPLIFTMPLLRLLIIVTPFVDV